EGLAPDRGGGVLDLRFRRFGVDAGVVHQDGGGAVVARHLVDEAAHAAGVAHVERIAGHVAAGRREALHGGLALGLRAAPDHHEHVGFHELSRDLVSDPAVATGHDGDPLRWHIPAMITACRSFSAPSAWTTPTSTFSAPAAPPPTVPPWSRAASPCANSNPPPAATRPATASRRSWRWARAAAARSPRWSR